jgi:hypothetical protein
MPSRIHAVDRPVPEPSSRNRPPGFEAANVRNREHVNDSDAIVNPAARVSAQIEETTFGSLRLRWSFIGGRF